MDSAKENRHRGTRANAKRREQLGQHRRNHHVKAGHHAAGAQAPRRRIDSRGTHAAASRTLTST